MSRSINNGEEMILGLELPKSDINGDTSLTLSLELIENPSVLEGTLSGLRGLLLVGSDDTLIDTSTLVDQVTSSGGLSGVDVTDHDERNVTFFRSGHF
jgi:hypothetical protein